MADRKRSGSRHPPDVVEYRDFRRFLRDTFRWRRARVTAERPELPPGQEPARVVLQQAMMSLPLVADGEAPEGADPSTD